MKLKKVLGILILSLIGITAHAQVSNTVTIKLTREEVKIVLDALSEKPYKQVIEVITNIVSQAYMPPSQSTPKPNIDSSHTALVDSTKNLKLNNTSSKSKK